MFIRSLLNGMNLIDILLLTTALLLSMILHEIAHGYTAYLMGDNYAKLDGRLSLNPLKHIDWIGFFMLMTVGFGWAKPVGVNMHRFKKPKLGMALTAFAGPFTNILLAFASCFAVIYFDIVGFNKNFLFDFFIYLMKYNVVLAMFNLIPLPPLDGSKILFSFLPHKWYYSILRFERYGMLIMFILLYTDLISPVLDNSVASLENLLIMVVLLILT